MDLFFFSVVQFDFTIYLILMFNPYSSNFNNPFFQNSTPTAAAPQSLIRVTGVEGAKAYQMPPNSVAPLFDANDDLLYIKSTDGAGFPTIRIFSFTEVSGMPQAQNPEYVTRAEFEQLKAQLLEREAQNVEQSISE